MSAIRDMVEQSGGAYGIAYGRDENERIVDIQLYAREDAAEALEGILREFERVWAEVEDGELTFTLHHSLAASSVAGKDSET